MLIHRCTGCGKFSINRVAADDNATRIYDLFLRSQTMEEKLKSGLNAIKILPLAACDLTRVHSRLFGWQSILEEFQRSGVTVREVETIES